MEAQCRQSTQQRMHHAQFIAAVVQQPGLLDAGVSWVHRGKTRSGTEACGSVIHISCCSSYFQFECTLTSLLRFSNDLALGIHRLAQCCNRKHAQPDGPYDAGQRGAGGRLRSAGGRRSGPDHI